MPPIPDNINRALIGIGWLIGHWEGTGYRQWPGEEKTQFGVTIDFAENGDDYLHYLLQSFEIDENAHPIRPLGMETGFWRAFEDASVEVEMCSPDGFAEIWYGKLQVTRIDLTTDAVARSAKAKVPYTAGRRLYGLVENKLMYSFDRATEDQPLQPYMWATLERV
ncbi:MAG: FABP family protein [Propionibacteriaceae bacterium]|nr:FABP family protein [Propionibacteriaceae bacterium]